MSWASRRREHAAGADLRPSAGARIIRSRLPRSSEAKVALSPDDRPKPAGHAEPVIVPRAEHPDLARQHLPERAEGALPAARMPATRRFLVGGAVRDLLLGLHRRTSTSRPTRTRNEVRQLFRNCRLIGRRFHLAHVRFGHEIIEVATFRAAHTEIDEDHGVDEGGHRVLDERGRILRDNVYGTIEEDVWRRDFTANALYYDIEDFSIWDYVGGFEDARKRVLRLIGDPETRYREDPVRMLRAVRFAAKLGFTMHPDTEAPIYRARVHARRRAAGAPVRRDPEACSSPATRCRRSSC